MSKLILCATDGSDHSELAVSYAANLAKAIGAGVTYLSVVPYSTGRGISTPMWAAGDVAKTLSAAVQTAEKAGVSGARRIEAKARDVAGAIVSCADKANADLIVVGSRGLGALSRFLIGSVSNEVFNKAHCPVTVVR